MRLLNYLKEDIIQKALEIEEPEVGKKYPSEKVKRYLKMIEDALKEMKKKQENDTNDAIVQDLRDKKDKWKNLDKETKPVITKQEEPPPEEEEHEEEKPKNGKKPPFKKGEDEEEEKNESKIYRVFKE